MELGEGGGRLAETADGWVGDRSRVRGALWQGVGRNEKGIAVPREGKARHLSERHFYGGLKYFCLEGMKRDA